MGLPRKYRNDPRRQKEEPREEKKFPWRKLLAILLWTVGLFAFHLAAVELCLFGQAVAIAAFWVYYAAVAILLVLYIVMNHAFTEVWWTEESLPDRFSPEEKQAMIRGRDERKRRSSALIPPIFGLAVTFLFEIFSLFFAEPIDAFLSAMLSFMGK